MTWHKNATSALKILMPFKKALKTKGKSRILIHTKETFKFKKDLIYINF